MEKEKGEVMSRILLIVVVLLICPLMIPHEVFSDNCKYLEEIYQTSEQIINITKIAEIIATRQTTDGGFAPPGMPPMLNFTALSLLALNEIEKIQIIDVDKALDFIADCQNPDGGFGNLRYFQDYDPSDLELTYLAVITCSEFNALHLINVSATRNYVINLVNNETLDTFHLALALSILKIIGGLDKVDKQSIINYITLNPPQGVNYAGIAYLNSPDDTIPTVISTWAGVQVLLILNHTDYINVNGILRFLKDSMNEDGGFKLSAYLNAPSSVDVTFYAVDLLSNLNLMEKTDLWKTALFTITIANSFDEINTGAEFTALTFSCFTLSLLKNLIIPYEVSISDTSVEYGEIINVSVRLISAFGEKVTGAHVYVTANAKIFEGYEKKSGEYEVIISTKGFKNGTYNAVLYCEKEDYIKAKYSFTFDVLWYLKIKGISYPAEVHVGEKFELIIEILDINGNPANASVTVILQDQERKADKIGGGIYRAVLTPRFPSENETITIIAEAKGYMRLTKKVFIKILPEEFKPIETALQQAILFILIFAGICTMIKIGRKEFVLSLITFVVLAFSLMYLVNVKLNYALLIASISSMLIALGLVKKRDVILRGIGMIILLIMIVLLAENAGFATYIMASLMFVTGAIAYIVSPGERNVVFKELMRNTIGWIITLFALSFAMSVIRTPFSLAGPLSPPSGISISVYGYIALLWYCVFIFVPIVTASKFAYLIAVGLKVNIARMYRLITGGEE